MDVKYRQQGWWYRLASLAALAVACEKALLLKPILANALPLAMKGEETKFLPL